jgi:hypothetical protein
MGYLNKLLIRDYERLFRASTFEYAMYPESFGSRWAQWTKPFLRIPWIREFVTGYLWVVLRKPAHAPNRVASYPLASGNTTPYHLNGHARKH